MPARRPRRRTALLAASTLVVAAAIVAVGYVAWPRSSEFDRATGLLPEGTLRIAWTDWSGVRAELGTGPVSGARSEEVLQQAEDRDLTSSSLAASAVLLEENLGFNPLATEWELLGQGRDGMVLVLKVGDGTDLAEVGERFAELGFSEPEEDAMAGAVWEGGADVVSNVPGLATYELQHVAFLADEGLLLASDEADYLADAVPVAAGDEDGLDAGVLTEEVGEPINAVGYLEDYACEALSMASADADAQAVGDQLVAEAGGVTALTGYLVALGAGERISVVFDFEDEDRARQNEASRRALAEVEDPAQFLSYRELFTVSSLERDGHTLVLTGETEPDLAPLSNLTEGPVLLATC
ncbi:hypothetical protein [Nocardioides donggukensis]|uniref:DUF3352 domain-containing protein n=1 Tax=Nocardioides donggukensis TaxID=2774019 RepID=A0A927K3I7_9ACTN|nr:hypothetical protein [Nocardioides donggukensis]MBD8868310.1 hypothetical protein [Nocardioides donggukensis]